jgi:hypothetical protein
VPCVDAAHRDETAFAPVRRKTQTERLMPCIEFGDRTRKTEKLQN